MKRDGLGEDAGARALWEGGLAARAGHGRAIPGAPVLPVAIRPEVPNQPRLLPCPERGKARKEMAIAPPNGNGNGRRVDRAHVSRHGRTAEIALTGELDLADRPQLRHAASRALAERPTEVLVIDMTRVSFFDSSVAHWLLEAHWQATAGGTRVVALVADRDARELLSVLGVAGVVSVVDG
jgi:anti-anti-sigma factor